MKSSKGTAPIKYTFTTQENPSFHELNDLSILTYLDGHSIDGRYLDSVKALTQFNDIVIAGWLHISPRTMRSYSAANRIFDRKLSEQVVMLRAVLEKGSIVFGGTEAFDTWLNTSNFFFDGKKPITFLDTTSGIRYIFGRVTAMEYGDNI